MDLDGIFTDGEQEALKQPDDEPETNEAVTGPTPETVVAAEPAPPVEEPAKVEEAQVEPKPEPEVKPEGILTKDGKHVIPFDVLEKERSEKRELQERLEKLEAASRGAAKPTKGIDFKAMAARLYENPEGAAEVLQAMFHAGVSSAQTVSQTTAQSAALKQVNDYFFQEKVNAIKDANPWLTGRIENVALSVALDMAREIPNFDPNNLGQVNRLVDDAVVETRKLVKVDVQPFDAEAERKKIREEEQAKATKEVMAKFNLSEPGHRTLAGVRNLAPEVTNEFDELDKLSGVRLERALEKLSPEKYDAYMNR